MNHVCAARLYPASNATYSATISIRRIRKGRREYLSIRTAHFSSIAFHNIPLRKTRESLPIVYRYRIRSERLRMRLIRGIAQCLRFDLLLDHLRSTIFATADSSLVIFGFRRRRRDVHVVVGNLPLVHCINHESKRPHPIPRHRVPSNKIDRFRTD